MDRSFARLALSRLLREALGPCAVCVSRVQAGLQTSPAPADGAICEFCGAHLCKAHLHRELVDSCEPRCWAA